MDADSGRVLYAKNGDQQLPMASTTKIMTCILALEEGNLEDVYEASAYAASMPKVHLGVRQGEQYRLEDLLYAMMLESYNDAAVVIAEELAGSVEAFAEKMNQKAWELGCLDTYFITPNTNHNAFLSMVAECAVESLSWGWCLRQVGEFFFGRKEFSKPLDF